MTAVTLRPEAPGDEKAIHTLTEAAFDGMHFSDGDEPDLIDALRRDGDLEISLVAENADRIVGHVAFSRVEISDKAQDWYDLGPVSVEPELQRQGIGSMLIKRGIADLRERGARGVVLLGNPAYYSRFGFEHDPRLQYPGPPQEFFQRLVLSGEPATGIVTFPKAFREL